MTGNDFYSGQNFFRRMCVCVALLALAGCSKTPTSDDVKTFLATQQPSVPYSVGDVQVQTTKGEGNKNLVTFKAALQLDKALYRAIDVEALLAKSGWDASAFSKLMEEANSMPSDLAEKVLSTFKESVVAPVVLEQTANPGDKIDWYGSLTAEYLVDKWSFSDLKTKERGEFKGDIQEKFGAKTYSAGKPETAEAIESVRKARVALGEAIKTNLQLAAERKNREQAEQQAQDLRIAQEETARTAESAKRRLPIQLSLRSATFGAARKVLVLRNSSGEPLSIELFITDGRGQRRAQLNLLPGQPQEFGWVQGWSFKSGDAVEISNRSFDMVKVRIP